MFLFFINEEREYRFTQYPLRRSSSSEEEESVKFLAERARGCWDLVTGHADATAKFPQVCSSGKTFRNNIYASRKSQTTISLFHASSKNFYHSLFSASSNTGELFLYGFCIRIVNYGLQTMMQHFE